MVGYFAILLAIALLPGGGIHSAAVIAAWYFLYHRPQKKEEAERDERWKKESEERQKQLVRQEEEKLNREVKSRAFETKLASDPVAARNFFFESLNIAKHYRGNGDFFVLLQTLAKAIGTPHKVVFLKRVPLTKTGGNSWGDAQNEGAQQEFHVLDAHDNVLAKVSSTYLANSQDGLIHGELYSRNDEFEFREFWFRLPDKREVEVSYSKHSCHAKTVEETFEINPPDFSIQDLGASFFTPPTDEDDDHPISREAASQIAGSAVTEAPSRIAPHFASCSICQTFFDPLICPNGCPQCARNIAIERNTAPIVKHAPPPAPLRQPSVTASTKDAGNTPHTAVPKQRCKICNIDFALGYVDSENICTYCAAKLEAEKASRVTAPIPEQTRVKKQEDQVAPIQSEPAERSVVHGPALRTRSVSPVTPDAAQIVTNETLPERPMHSTPISHEDSPCDFPSCRSPSKKQLGDKRYCIAHLPMCGIPGCQNRALSIVSGQRRCNRHADDVMNTVLDEPRKNENTYAPAAPSHFSPPVENLRPASLKQQLVQLGCTVDGSTVTLPDGTTRYIASTFDLEDIRDELVDRASKQPDSPAPSVAKKLAPLAAVGHAEQHRKIDKGISTSSQTNPAAAPGIKSSLNPSAEWPFSTGSRP